MSIKSKILLLLSGCLVFFSLAVILFMDVQKAQLDVIAESSTEQLDVLATNAIQVKTDQLEQVIRDYTNWDELIQNLSPPNQGWAFENIGTITSSFTLRSADIFDINKKLAFHFGNSIINEPAFVQARESIFGLIYQKRIAHFFLRTSTGLLEITGGTVHRTSDTLRTGEPQGYFLIAKTWGPSFIEKLALNSGSEVSLSNEILEKPSADQQTVFCFKELQDPNGELAGVLVFKKTIKALSLFNRMSRFVLFFLILFLFSILGIFFFILNRWIQAPLEKISQGLKDHNSPMLESLIKRKNEFSQIAGLIRLNNEQQLALEEENAKRREAQEMMVHQNQLMESLSEASHCLLSIEDFDDAMTKSIQAINKVADIDLIFIYKKHSDPHLEVIHMERIHDWVKPDYQEKFTKSTLESLMIDPNQESWFFNLIEGKPTKGFTRDFTDPFLKVLQREGIMSFLLIPVFDPKNQDLWGMGVFANYSASREWLPIEEFVFQMLASNIGSAIRRHLFQEDLKKATELAQAADRAKSDFLASMSHEIRTPMNGIIGMTSLLVQTELSPVQREYIETIETSGDSLLNIINEILDFSKIEMGKLDLEESPFDLRRCVEDVLDLMAPKSFEKRIEIFYYIEEDIPTHIYGDGFRLRQILVNLFGNALKFTEVGEVFLSIRQFRTDGQVYLEFSVKDTGIGIPDEKQEILFQPFTQVDSSTTRKYGGTGLGLAITARLVDLMHGKIWVISKLGEGSDFRFTIRTEFITPPETKTPTSSPLVNLQGKKILIVDDNATNRKILEKQCAYWKMESKSASSGKECLELLKTNTFDAGILDLLMPEMDGIMLARKIRETYTKNTLPLICLTSTSLNFESHDMKNLFSYHVSKPIKHSQVAEILVKIFQNDAVSLPQPRREAAEKKDLSVSYPFQILVAEDNFINQKLIRYLFEVLGFKTDLAANGLEVIESLKKKSYQFIFMDIQMPEMDGMEATRLIRERWTFDMPIIVAMTANAMQGDREKCIDAGMDDYISKPLRIEDLVRVITFWGDKILTNQKNNG